MSLFHTPTVVKMLRIVGFVFFHSYSYKKCEIVDTLIRDSEIGRSRDRCSKIADITIPYSNTSRSIKDSWFAFSSILMPTKNAKSLTPLSGNGGSE